MAMLKSLRKHNKWILVFGGSLLMVGWLLQGSLKQLGPSRKGPLQGSLDGRKVYLVEFSTYTEELRALRALLPAIVDNLLGQSTHDDGAHWMLLAAEAEGAGFVGGPQDGADWLQEVAPQEAYLELRSDPKFAQFDDATFQRLIEQFPNLKKQYQDRTDALRSPRALEAAAQAGGRMTVEEVQTALARARGIFRMQSAYLTAPRASDRLALSKARKWGDQAVADLVFIPSELLIAGAPEPTEDELATHFQKYRDTTPGSGQFGVGYRLPPRLKLEWLKLDRAAIREAIPVDPVAAYKEWQTHRDTFKGEFAEEKDKVESQLRDRRADEVMSAAAQVVKAEVFKAVKRLDHEGDYRKLPADWGQSRPRLDDIAKAVQAQTSDTTGVKVPLPVVTIRDSKWQTAADLSADPTLAATRIHFAAQAISLVPALFQVRELGGDPRLAFQTGIPITDYPGDDSARDLYFFTVLDARKESAPDSLDEVRDQAIADFKKIKAYDTLAAKVDEYRQTAIAGGPSAVVDSFRPDAPDAPQTLKLPTVVAGVTISRTSARQAGEQFNTDAFRTAVVDAADKIDPLTDPASYDSAAATVVVPVPEHLALAVARIKSVRPLTWEVYRQYIEQALSGDARDEVRQASLSNPFSYEAVSSRHGWKSRVEDEDQGGQPAQPPAPATGATPPL